MVKIKSTSRFSNQLVYVILTQTDTTVGFLSQNETKLKEIKSRSTSKPFIKVYSSFKNLKSDAIRVPDSQKKRVRRAQQSTFILKKIAFRIAKNSLNSSFLNSSWNYSTSANEAGKHFDRLFCEAKADIIIEGKLSLHEGTPSALYKINSKNIRRLR